MGIIFYILTVVIGAIVVFGSYTLLSRFVFNRVSVNKWILLAIAIIVFIPQFFIPAIPYWVKLLCDAVAIVIFFWFIDVFTNGNPRIKKEKKIVMKPKAKPNRIKNNKDK